MAGKVEGIIVVYIDFATQNMGFAKKGNMSIFVKWKAKKYLHSLGESSLIGIKKMDVMIYHGEITHLKVLNCSLQDENMKMGVRGEDTVRMGMKTV